MHEKSQQIRPMCPLLDPPSSALAAAVPPPPAFFFVAFHLIHADIHLGKQCVIKVSRTFDSGFGFLRTRMRVQGPQRPTLGAKELAQILHMCPNDFLTAAPSTRIPSLKIVQNTKEGWAQKRLHTILYIQHK